MSCTLNLPELTVLPTEVQSESGFHWRDYIELSLHNYARYVLNVGKCRPPIFTPEPRVIQK